MHHILQEYEKRLKEKTAPVLFDAFIKSSRFRLENAVLSITAPNRATARWLQQNIEAPFRDYVTQALNKPVSVSYAISAQPFADGANGAANGAGADAAAGDNIQAPPLPEDRVQPQYAPAPASSSKTGLLQRYTFANLVRGQANEIPLVAGQQIAKGVGQTRLLFVYGSSGLGKTHLIHAIGNEYLKNFPAGRALYVSARAFMNNVVQAYRSGNQEQFKNRYYKNIDLLIVDDIQHIGGDKTRTQEEFFFLFNSLIEQNKFVVISSDRAPSHIKDLPVRLTTRFNAGLPTHIAPPEYEMRVEILRKKSQESNLSVSDEVLAFIAENIKSNVRELEGAINRLQAMSQFRNAEITVSLCQSALDDLIGQNNVMITADKIKEKVSAYYHIKTADLGSKKRHRNIVIPRHIAVYLCRENTNLSLPEIGKQFGDRNHTTVLHSIRYVENAIKTDKALTDEIKKIETAIREA